MQTAATYYATPSQAPADPLRASVTHLLARAYGLPCSAVAQAFTQLVQSASRFQVALETLLPLLSGNAEVRMLACAFVRCDIDI